MPEPADTLIGTVIDGRFEIRDKLGQGGMGTVYRAWQRSVGREVAIKLIDRSISNDPMSTRRFLREAHLASQLSHPNTISVFDFGQMPDGRLFTAMELLRGRTLGRELRAVGAFPLARIVRIGTQVCDALEAAHGQRIVHRDLKLDNVMLLDHGNDLIKVLDFGLAKTLDDKSTQATAAGIVVGTPRYIAPETAMTGDATPASDMYAVGVMLGELALATPLWEGTSLSVILQYQLKPEPIIATVPRPLRDVVARLLHPRPQGRPTASETRTLLQLLGEGKPLPVPAEQRATLDIKKATRDRESEQPARKRDAAPIDSNAATTERETLPPLVPRKFLIGGGAIVFVVSVVIAYVATRKSKPSAPAPALVQQIDAAATDDPWRDHLPKSPSAEAPTDTPPSVSSPSDTPLDAALPDRVTIKVVGIPKGFLLDVNGRRFATTLFSVERGDLVALEVWNPDHSVQFKSRTITVTKNDTIDMSVRKLGDCESSDVARRDLCRQVYCQSHRSDTSCPGHDDDLPVPFE